MLFRIRVMLCTMIVLVSSFSLPYLLNRSRLDDGSNVHTIEVPQVGQSSVANVVLAANVASARVLDYAAIQTWRRAALKSELAEAAQAFRVARERVQERRQSSVAPAATTPVSGAVGVGGDLFAFLAQCETQTTWTWYTQSYEGAYGFTHQTWDQFKVPGFPDSANLATPVQQTQVARILHDKYGLRPWPACGVKARSEGFS